jgi:tRNA threonylcarbamoyladenosine biosynthesis protein TsaE
LKTRGKRGEKACIIALQGDLGSGKTTFVKAVAETLGIRDTVTSPTFVLEKIYKIEDKTALGAGYTHLIHIDAYRLENSNEMSALGFDEILEKPENLVFIEWPERISQAIPKNAQILHFRFVNEKTREITVS